MRQQVTVNVLLTYDADARLSAAQLWQAITDDINRLLDADSESHVGMIDGDIIALTEEAELYGNA